MYRLTKQEDIEVKLMSLDDTGETTATVRKAIGRDNLALEQVVQRPQVSYLISGEEVIEKMPVSDYMTRARKVWICLVDTNILDADGKKWWKPGLSWEEFLPLWGAVGSEVQDALYDAVISQNMHWGN